MSSQAIRKLKREYKALDAEPVHDGIMVLPLESNLFHAHFLLTGEIFYDSPYEGGIYHGVLKFPKNYPFAPPAIQMITPNGRFQVQTDICCSMSNFHPESWRPTWTMRTIINGFVSFMNSDEMTTGGLQATTGQRVLFARKSLETCLQHQLTHKLFGDLLEAIQSERAQLSPDDWPVPRPTKTKAPSIVSEESPTKTSEPNPKLESTTVVGSSGKNAARNKKKREKEKKKKIATKFLAQLHEQGPGFVDSIVHKLQSDYNILVHNLPADHICYRTSSIDEYNGLVDALKSSSTDCTLLVESTIGGRLIATFRLAKPISCTSQHSVHVVEIPAPKEGRPYSSGLEHVEFVIPSSNHTKVTPENNDEHKSTLQEWMDAHPKIEQWNRKGLDKSCNPDVSTQLAVESYGTVTIKFHLVPLEDVIHYELGQTSEQETA